MSNKYQTYTKKEDLRDREVRLHPVWRGVGFALIVLTPIMAYAATLVILDANTANNWVQIPKELLYQGSDPLLFAKMILTVVLIFLIGSFFSLITFILYGAFGPKRYGPMDAPPTVYRGGRYKR